MLLASIVALTLLFSVVSSINPIYFAGLNAYADNSERDEEDDDSTTDDEGNQNEENPRYFNRCALAQLFLAPGFAHRLHDACRSTHTGLPDAQDRRPEREAINGHGNVAA